MNTEMVSPSSGLDKEGHDEICIALWSTQEKAILETEDFSSFILWEVMTNWEI